MRQNGRSPLPSTAKSTAAQAGTVAIEFALVVPVLLALLWGIIEYGRLMWWQSTIRYATQEGARCAAINCCTSASSNCTSASEYAAAKATGWGLTAANFVQSADNGRACIQAQDADGGPLPFTFIVPAISNPANLSISSAEKSCYPM